MTYRVMTVCTGNICRSPMAEVLLQQAFDAAGMDVVVTSSGVSDEEQGNPMDRRAAQVLSQNGIKGKPNHRARQATPQDLQNTDLIIPMTAAHAKALRTMAKQSGMPDANIKMMRSFDPPTPAAANGALDDSRLDVDDPWYGGVQDFQDCLAELQQAVPGVVGYVKQQMR